MLGEDWVGFGWVPGRAGVAGVFKLMPYEGTGQWSHLWNPTDYMRAI